MIYFIRSHKLQVILCRLYFPRLHFAHKKPDRGIKYKALPSWLISSCAVFTLSQLQHILQLLYMILGKMKCQGDLIIQRNSKVIWENSFLKLISSSFVIYFKSVPPDTKIQDTMIVSLETKRLTEKTGKNDDGCRCCKNNLNPMQYWNI